METDTFEVIKIAGVKALYSDKRLDSSGLPGNLHVYDIRNAGKWGVLEPKVLVNHAATIVTAVPIEFPKDGFIILTEETSPNFLDEDEMTLQEFARKYKK